MPVLKNEQHEAFAQSVAAGNPAGMAYRHAGYTAKTRNVADVGGSRLLRNAQIRARINDIKERVSAKAEARAEWTAADRLATLARITERAEHWEPKTAVSAIAEANKMQGSHAPAKQELTGRDGQPLNPPVQKIVIVAASEEDAEDDE